MGQAAETFQKRLGEASLFLHSGALCRQAHEPGYSHADEHDDDSEFRHDGGLRLLLGGGVDSLLRAFNLLINADRNSGIVRFGG